MATPNFTYPTTNPYLPPQAKPYQLTNTAAPDPWLLDFQRSWQARLGQLQADEGKLQAESDARTKQMISQATGDIADRASGANAALSEDLARRGVAGAGVEAGQRGSIGDAAQREQARQSTNIALAQNDKYQAEKLARQNQLNNFMAAGAPVASQIGQRQLDAQRLGLQQYEVMNNQADKERQEKQQYGQYFTQKKSPFPTGGRFMSRLG